MVAGSPSRVAIGPAATSSAGRRRWSPPPAAQQRRAVDGAAQRDRAADRRAVNGNRTPGQGVAVLAGRDQRASQGSASSITAQAARSGSRVSETRSTGDRRRARQVEEALGHHARHRPPRSRTSPGAPGRVRRPSIAPEESDARRRCASLRAAARPGSCDRRTRGSCSTGAESPGNVTLTQVMSVGCGSWPARTGRSGRGAGRAPGRGRVAVERGTGVDADPRGTRPSARPATCWLPTESSARPTAVVASPPVGVEPVLVLGAGEPERVRRPIVVDSFQRTAAKLVSRRRMPSVSTWLCSTPAASPPSRTW